jgi:hypothetical protein
VPHNNKPPYQPRHGGLSTLKGHVPDAEALNAGEELAQTLKGRSMTAEERGKTLSTGRAMNAGTAPEMSLTPRKLFGPTP